MPDLIDVDFVRKTWTGAPGVPDVPLKDGDGGGTSGGVTEDWKSNVDRQLTQLHNDIRSLLRWGIAAVIALAAMIGGLYLRTDGKFEAAAQKASAIELQAVKSDAKLDTLIERTAPKK